MKRQIFTGEIANEIFQICPSLWRSPPALALWSRHWLAAIEFISWNSLLFLFCCVALYDCRPTMYFITFSDFYLKCCVSLKLLFKIEVIILSKITKHTYLFNKIKVNKKVKPTKRVTYCLYALKWSHHMHITLQNALIKFYVRSVVCIQWLFSNIGKQQLGQGHVSWRLAYVLKSTSKVSVDVTCVQLA
jgi:hypothetical protein